MELGDIVFCKLTGKRMIIQKILHSTVDDPMYVEKKKEVEKFICRYWSRPQDRFFTTVAYPDEVSTSKPLFPRYESVKE